MLGFCCGNVKILLQKFLTNILHSLIIYKQVNDIPLCGLKYCPMEKKTIMVVDDEQDIREILEFNLENAGYEVIPAASAEDALERTQDADLILLDVMMEGMSGFKMAEILRKERRSQIPIIFLTARSAENDLLTGFSAGGDDYISKPFSINEVLARVKAVLKRSAAIKPEKPVRSQIELGKLRIDVDRKMVYVDGVAVVFPKKELEILTLLASHPGRIYSREEMINELWDDAPYVLDRTVDVHIARIRSKLGVCKGYLTNRSGYGYSMNAED